PMADQDRIDAFATAYQLTFPLIPDTSHHQVTLFDATMMPQAVVWDHRTNRLLYRGRIDDSYVRVGKRNLHPKRRDLENMVKKWLDGIIPDHLVETQAIGCVIDRRS